MKLNCKILLIVYATRDNYIVLETTKIGNVTMNCKPIVKIMSS